LKIAVLIPAAGLGRRLRSNEGKAFLPLAGHSLLSYSLQTLSSIEGLSAILVGLRPEEMQKGSDLIKKMGISSKLVRFIKGGKERSDTVQNLITDLEDDASDAVLIHDAARPFVSVSLTQSILKALKKHPAVVPGIESRDTIKICNNDGFVIETPKRHRLRSIQTPQGFHLSLLKSALKNSTSLEDPYTDEASIVERAGFKVLVIPGDNNNFKITYLEDLKYAEWIISSRECFQKLL